MLRDIPRLLKITLPADVGTKDRAYVLFEDLGFSEGEAASLRIAAYRKYTADGVLEDAADDRDPVAIAMIDNGDDQGLGILVTEGTTGFTAADYYEIELEVVAEVLAATATAYTAE